MKVRTKQTQLKVVKADGSIEGYLHTKVLGTICNALASVGQADAVISEDLAESVTYYLYHRNSADTVTSGEIFSIIKAVLASTGFETAAASLSEHHHHRRIRRNRVEVARVDIERLSDAELLYGEKPALKTPWNKSVITGDLVSKHKFSYQTARAVAAMVEEKILNMGSCIVPASLIKQLVLGDAAAILNAQRQLQTA